MNFKNGTRRAAFRYAAIRNGVELCPIQAVGAPGIDMVASGEVKTSISGNFVVPPAVDWLTDMLQPYIILDGVEYQLGRYVISTVDEEYEAGTVHHNLQGYDQGIRVKNMPLTEPLYISSGESYMVVIQKLLLRCGIEHVIVEPSSAYFISYREDWEIGDSMLTIINTLLSEINYNSLWFDHAGSARISKYRHPTAELAAHTYRADEMSVIKEQSTRTLDSYGAYNHFIVMVSSPDYDEPLIAEAVNNNPISALSVQRIGKRTAPIVRLNNIGGLSELQDYANNLVFKSMMTNETVQFSTANMPHEVGDVVILEHPQLKGVYEETEWSITLEAGADMVHKGKRVVYLD